MKKTVLNIFTGIMIGSLLFSTANTPAKTNEVEVLNYDVYVDGEKLQLGKKKGYFYDEGKYVNPTISYNDTIYVPLNYFSHLTPEYQIYSEDNVVYVNSPENIAYTNTKIEEKQKNSKELTLDDLTLQGVNIKPLDSYNATIKRIESKYKDIIGDESTYGDIYFFTDSVYTDTSYILTITKDRQGKITDASYDQFIRPDQGSLNVTTKRGIKVRSSKVKDVIKAYGNDYRDETYTYPDGSGIYTLYYDFRFDSGLIGSLVFMADFSAKQKVDDAVIYSVGFETF